MTEWYDFPNVKSTKMLSFLFGSRGLRPDLPSPFGRKFLFCIDLYYFKSIVSSFKLFGRAVIGSCHEFNIVFANRIMRIKSVVT